MIPAKLLFAREKNVRINMHRDRDHLSRGPSKCCGRSESGKLFSQLRMLSLYLLKANTLSHLVLILLPTLGSFFADINMSKRCMIFTSPFHPLPDRLATERQQQHAWMWGKFLPFHLRRSSRRWYFYYNSFLANTQRLHNFYVSILISSRRFYFSTSSPGFVAFFSAMAGGSEEKKLW